MISVVGDSTSSAVRRRATITICAIIALLEGLDLQSIGVAAPRMAHSLGLSVAQMGWVFSAGTFGLMPGAWIGGRLADRFGRKRLLAWSVAIFGLFSIWTAQVSSLDSLLAVRFMAGIGLGGAMPNLIALCSEAVPERLRNTAVGIMYCGTPLGGAIAALLGMFSPGDEGWRHIFYVGGAAPLIVTPLLIAWLPESAKFEGVVHDQARRRLDGMMHALWGDGRALITVLLWVSYLCTLLVVNFLLNWLPSMTIGRGLTRMQTDMVQILFNVGGGVGVFLFGRLLDRARLSFVVLGMYSGIVVALATLTLADRVASIVGAAALAGMFLVGTQAALYSLAGAYYPTHIRGTGVGAAVAMGRFGAILGPLVAGELMSLGHSGVGLIGASIPVTIVAALVALCLVSRPRAVD